MPEPSSRRIAVEAARIAYEHKAEDVKVLDLRGLFVADYFVIATILNRHHARAIADELPKPLGVEGLDEGAWALVDLGDVVVHLFEGEHRKFYDLEMLWGDAPKVAWRAPKAPAKAKTPRARASR